MTSAAEAVRKVITDGRGHRPASLHDGEAEKVLAIALALLVEVSAQQERLELLEQEVAALRGLPVEDWKNNAEPIRTDAVEALQLRVLRPLIDSRQG